MGNCSMARPHMDSQRPSTRTLVLRGVRDALALPAWVVGLSLFAVGSLAGETGFPAGTAVLSTLLIWDGAACRRARRRAVLDQAPADGDVAPAAAARAGAGDMAADPRRPLRDGDGVGRGAAQPAHPAAGTAPALLSRLRQHMHRRLRRHELPRLFAGRGAAAAARRRAAVPDADLLHAVARGGRARGVRLARHRLGLCACAALVRARRQELRSPADRACRRHRGVRAAKGQGRRAMSASGLWPYLLVIVFGFLPSEVWRVLAVFAARGFDERAEILVWVRAVATTLVAGVVAKILFSPTGALVAVPLAWRLGALAIGVAAFFLARRSVMAGG